MCLQPAPEGAPTAQCLWRWMANCSRRAEQRPRRPGLQSSNDAMTALREQTLTQNAAVFLRQCPPHDTARSPYAWSKRCNTIGYICHPPCVTLSGCGSIAHPHSTMTREMTFFSGNIFLKTAGKKLAASVRNIGSALPGPALVSRIGYACTA